MTACSYASCDQPAVKKLDGWDFCRDHVDSHASETVGSTITERPAQVSGPRSELSPAHGTYAGFHRHLRARETPCQPCAQANTDRKRLYKQNARRNARQAA